MQHTKHHTTTEGYNIYVYDDVIPHAYRNQFIYKIINSNFHPGGNDNSGIDISARHLHSSWSHEDLDNSMFLRIPELQPLLNKHLNGYKVSKTRINLCSFSDHNNFHLDEFFGKTLLYYANHEWDLRWGGLTLFGDHATQSKLDFAVDLVPGRIVIFDGNIPHMVQAPTVMSPVYRYTMAIQFILNQGESSST